MRRHGYNKPCYTGSYPNSETTSEVLQLLWLRGLVVGFVRGMVLLE